MLQAITVCGQEEEFITGYLIDQTTEEPVVFATIRLSSKALGVISNQDGSFRIPKRFTRLDEKLVISCLGYQEKKLLFSELSLETVNQIRLTPKRMELNEAVLVGKRKRPPSARQIVKRAIARIPQNYPTVPFAYVGYYRDYQLKKNEYVNLNEALLHVTDMGFEQNDWDHTKIQIYDYKANYDFKRDSVSDNPYNYSTRQKFIENAFLPNLGGNELNILRIHDPIRNHDVKSFSFVDILNKDLLRNHSFSRERDLEINGERMYVIQLEKTYPTKMTMGTKMISIRVLGRFISQVNLRVIKAMCPVKRREHAIFRNPPMPFINLNTGYTTLVTSKSKKQEMRLQII